MGAGEDFEVILEEIWGSGKYQKRLTLVLLGNLFFLMPFALLVQMFVLHIPGQCTGMPQLVVPIAFCLYSAGLKTQFFLLIFTLPGTRLLEQPGPVDEYCRKHICPTPYPFN